MRNEIMTVVRTILLLIIMFLFLGAVTLLATGCEQGPGTGVTTSTTVPVIVTDPVTTTTSPVKPTVTTTTVLVSARIPLYWESTTEPHPERKPWSDKIIENAKRDLALYSSAKDMTEICPRFKSLNERDKLKAIGEFWVATAFYESSFNPNSNSVDVGKPGDKGSWSVGLYQMSANDSSAKMFNATFETLKNPIVNINVAMEQMKRQITNTQEILLHNSSPRRYWAVLLEGNKYSKIPEIKGRVLKYAPLCK